MKFLKGMLIVLLVSLPSLLSIPMKGRESGGIVLDSKEYDKEFLCLKNALWHEARGEPEEGIRAVMSVIYNRKKSKSYPDTFCSVILQDKQFSAFNDNKELAMKRLKPLREQDKQAYRVVAGVAKEAVQGAFKPVLEDGVLFFHASSVSPYWKKYKEKVKVIQNHIFYKDKNV